MWLRSKNCEEWLQRRVNYTRSMALMSMVGYILGLGDRHPSNIMMSRETGSICHIDFGDCFEVAMHREKFPEKYPFRLTRMLVKAMEASGIEGTYRSTCETVMSLLRQYKDRLMAILEAFVLDTSVGQLNSQAVAVIQRVQDKLTGRDFYEDESLSVPDQVDRLINQATDPYNLAQSYIGWYVDLVL